ncbi:MAG: repeat containing protein, partial [Chthonomonadales bacterium]|nr:repeat containing protein [Chthonomonadales bacterium]
NLLSAAYFAKAGAQTVWWDGLDDLGRDTEAARHGIYSAPGQFVAPGSYRVRGLVRPNIDLHHEFSVYNAGHPAWETADHTGGWLTNHTPPGCTLFVPGDRAPGGKPLVFIGSYVAEGGDGLAWVDLDGHKQGGRGWIGGTWTGAQFLARDSGSAAAPEIYAYAAAAWETDKDREKGEIRLTGLTAGGDRALLKYIFAPDWKLDPNATREHEWGGELGGLAVRNGLLAFSLTRRNKIVMVDVRTGKVQDELTVDSPRGLAFEENGALLALSGTHLLRMTVAVAENSAAGTHSVGWKPQDLVSVGLSDPIGLTLDKNGTIYISDQGSSHQVKVFSPDGKLLRTLGHPGAPRAGRYDREHMNHPKGLAIDERDQLWVAEEDFQPKRVSVWSLDGKLLHDYYGPSQYGGGGTLDPKDRSRFYYNGMEFRLDWQHGTDQLVQVYYRPAKGELGPPDGYGSNGLPETPLYAHGAQYMTNAYNSNPTNGASIAMLWKVTDGRAHPVAAMGRANDWSLLKAEAFRSRWPQGLDLKGDTGQNQTLFVWSDRNGDGQMQPDEVTMRKAEVGGVTLMSDLAFVEARVGDKTMRYAPSSFTAQGTPLYDLDAGQAVATAAQGPVSSGGDQALVASDGWTILTNAPKPFSAYGLGGVKNGKALWAYPSLWPGLHASHESPAPDQPGELIGTTRLLGTTVTPKGGEAGALWAINGNMGAIYLFTTDGLFVAQLFQDVRQGQTWSMPTGARGMKMNALTLHDENFWPSITQTSTDGKIYLVDGGHTSLVRVDGLEEVHRLPPVAVSISPEDLKRAQQALVLSEAQRQKASGLHLLHVASRTTPPNMDGNLTDWKDADWATIDKRGVNAYFNSDSKPYDVKAALAIAGERLYVAYHTGDKELLRNSGETPNALFKTGGALDLMLGTHSDSDPKRQKAVEGDVRLLVTLIKGKPHALLYRAVVPGTKEPVAFRSPSRGITLDRVDDVSDQIQLASDSIGNYVLSIPLATLRWKPQSGQKYRGDIGVLRGNGFQTLQRVYWSNKATGITADVPSEAELTPQLWGEWQVSVLP